MQFNAWINDNLQKKRWWSKVCVNIWYVMEGCAIKEGWRVVLSGCVWWRSEYVSSRKEACGACVESQTK